MKRRTAIKSILLGGTAIAGGFGGWKAYQIFKTPDISSLKNNLPLLNALAQTIIPRTDSPGAGDANAAKYIADILAKCYDKKTQNRFLDGLDQIQNKAVSRFDLNFENCSEEQRIELLKEAEKEGKTLPGSVGKLQKKLLGDSFFTTLKELTCEAYCTSMEGMNQGLAYDYVPGKFQGCITLTPGQKSWATK
ncbi:MAG: gluconate 2-dehydrogenase subunit 3 family protein [Bacteroidia bacterium]